MWATLTWFSPPSPKRTPGLSETTPATRVSYGWLLGVTSFGRVASRTTTVPASIFFAAGTHSATSWYFAAMLPSTWTLPATWNIAAGALVPMPTFPFVPTTTRGALLFV